MTTDAVRVVVLRFFEREGASVELSELLPCREVVMHVLNCFSEENDVKNSQQPHEERNGETKVLCSLQKFQNGCQLIDLLCIPW